jgi:hypothetical protein
MGVRTPLALFTALLLKEPVPGNPCAKEFAMLATPMAISSWPASTAFPFAEYREKNKFNVKK